MGIDSPYVDLSREQTILTYSNLGPFNHGDFCLTLNRHVLSQYYFILNDEVSIIQITAQ